MTPNDALRSGRPIAEHLAAWRDACSAASSELEIRARSNAFGGDVDGYTNVSPLARIVLAVVRIVTARR